MRKNLTFAESVQSCGDTLNTSTGSFQTPSLVDRYGTKLDLYGFHEDCLWILKGREKYVILLSFLYFELESSKKCELDYVEVRDAY